MKVHVSLPSIGSQSHLTRIVAFLVLFSYFAIFLSYFSLVERSSFFHFIGALLKAELLCVLPVQSH